MVNNNAKLFAEFRQLRCSTCKEPKPIFAFHKNKHAQFGR
jgi:hypothetical protein